MVDTLCSIDDIIGTHFTVDYTTPNTHVLMMVSVETIRRLANSCYDLGYKDCEADSVQWIKDEKNDSYNTGYSDGLDEGKDIGYDKGHTEGYREGHSEGYDAAYREIEKEREYTDDDC